MKLFYINWLSSVTHQEIMASMEDFIRLRSPEKLTIVIVDNASVHHKAVKKSGWKWLGHRVRA